MTIDTTLENHLAEQLTALYPHADFSVEPEPALGYAVIVVRRDCYGPAGVGPDLYLSEAGGEWLITQGAGGYAHDLFVGDEADTIERVGLELAAS